MGVGNYWGRVKDTISSFWQRGDTLRCVRIHKKEGSVCQMCGHKPIAWNHVLSNVKTAEELVVGSECINNYKKFTRDSVVFPRCYAKAAMRLNQRHPGCVVLGEDAAEQAAAGDDDMEDYDPEEAEREIYDALGLDPEDPDPGDLAPEGLSPDEVDWDSHDYESE